MEEELRKYLDSLAQPGEQEGLSSCVDYRVERLLGCSELEETQLVYRVSGNGEEGTERGPYVRKLIEESASGGRVYELLYQAQREGVEFNHVPGIVDLYHAGGRLAVVTEFIEGNSLASVVSSLGASTKLAQHVFLPLCDAVIELHECSDAPIIHRDLKPSNIMLSAGQAYLIDFGIARLFKEGGERDTARFGTRTYAPPEQFGFGQTDVRSDVYALGMVLYFLLMGTQPPLSLVGAARPESIPGALWEVIVTATQFAPASRFADVRALKSAATWAFTTADASNGLCDELAFGDGGQSVESGSFDSCGSGVLGETKGAPASRPASCEVSSLEEAKNVQHPDRLSEFAPVAPGGMPMPASASAGVDGAAPKLGFGHVLSGKTRFSRFVLSSWNILLLAGILLLIVGLTYSVSHPPEGEVVQGTVLRTLESLGLLVVPATLLAYGLADLRRLPSWMPLSNRPWKSRLGLMAKCALALFVASLVLCVPFAP